MLLSIKYIHSFAVANIESVDWTFFSEFKGVCFTEPAHFCTFNIPAADQDPIAWREEDGVGKREVRGIVE